MENELRQMNENDTEMSVNVNEITEHTNMEMSEEPVREENVFLQENMEETTQFHASSVEEVRTETTQECKEAVSEVRDEVFRHEPTSPYSPLYVPDKKQTNNNKITLCLVVVLLLTLVAGMIAAVSFLVEGAMKEVSTGASSWKSAIEEFVQEMKEEVAPKPDYEKSDGFGFSDGIIDEYDTYEDYDDYEDYEDYYEGVYVPRPEDEYYLELADSIREDLSYSAEKDIYTFFEEEKEIYILVEYVVVDGETLFVKDKINEHLKSGAMYYAKEFGTSDVTDLSLSVTSYVTYMDEDILSVVVDERYVWDDIMAVDLYCMNIDIKTGELLYNTEIIEPSEELAKAFLEMNEYQNGYIEYLDKLSVNQVCRLFEEENNLILFYTPVGLEIGLNYEDGWVTATLKDYEKYLRRV